MLKHVLTYCKVVLRKALPKKKVLFISAAHYYYYMFYLEVNPTCDGTHMPKHVLKTHVRHFQAIVVTELRCTSYSVGNTKGSGRQRQPSVSTYHEAGKQK